MTATFEFDPQLRLRHDPDRTIRSLDDAAQFLDAHALAFADREAAQFHQRMTHCASDTAAKLANEFQQWATQKHLLMADRAMPHQAGETAWKLGATLDNVPETTY